ncbi:alanine--glyoxylate aminotransferase 2, mitochondrial isoform X2 [Gallus gallus]|uniref:Alanine--glyoxylate aminotransferase 2, mitochondrial n=1 Tax=Gallus gallus TaxID=9031 RepID=A0A8V0YLL2_CHICK|nr:alanine--glyoxylate aminotransferase 2, mitochondrial isoform X2 [Gallus gallus]XP_429219.4 alanine--glyoxylate aminotransferase 2, mitochondrial isoform X2 [Gallus gallus]
MPASHLALQPCRRVVFRQQKWKSSVSMRAKMPPCDFVPEEYRSYPYERMLKIREQNIAPSLRMYYKKPLLLHQGHMQWLFDYEGRRYLDLFAGIVTVSVGHCHPKVTLAAQKQLACLWHTTNIYMHPSIHEYAEKLTSLLPDPLKVVYLTNSGSEANDLAMFMARLYTRNFDVICLRGAYHGGSPYALGLTSIGSYKHGVANGIGCSTTMLPDVFRGPWGGSNCRDSPVQTVRKCSCSEGVCHANEQYIEQFKDTLNTSVPKTIAGFIAEPIQGINGAVQYPKGFLKEAYRLVRERGGVCIADEVQTGFGRTGSHFWGFQTHDVVPDIITLAKGIGNGFPMAAVVTTKEIANSLAQNLHFNTFGGNPMACVVGSAVLDAIEEDSLQKNSKDVGTYMLLELAKLRDKFEIVGDVRGKGLMIGIEMVTDKDSRHPLPAEEINQIWEDCKDMGVLIGRGGLYNQTFRIKPPMCITRKDVDFAVEVIHTALERHVERAAAN